MSVECDVSFFIPIYCPPLKWLDAAVRSVVRVIRNSRCRAELLLGDDGSPDNCFPVLESYEKEFPGVVRAFHFPENRGVGAVSCDLAARAAGRYIASFDQDDIMLPFDLDRAVDFMDANQKYGASYARKFLFDDRGLTGDIHGNPVSPFIQFFQPKININAMLIRREVLFAHESFKPLPYCRINHDVWLMLRLAEDTFYYYDREVPRTLYRVHRKQSSTRHGDGQQDWMLIGQDIACRNHELYHRIVFEDDFPTPRTPIEDQLIQGLCGLAVFLNQRNQPLMWRMVDRALEAHPEDYGVREIRLQLSQFDREKFLSEYRRAMRDFAVDANARYVFAGIAAETYRKWGGQVPAELLAELQELRRICDTPPPLVTDNVPVTTGKSGFSWNIPGLKI